MERKKKVNTYLKLDVNGNVKSMQQHPNTRLQANRMGNLEFRPDLDYKSVSNVLLFRKYKWGRMSRQTDVWVCKYMLAGKLFHPTPYTMPLVLHLHMREKKIV